ncbi:MAG: rhamnogalacturonan acetylesterase [Lentisphaeraceae bacterium]|nr:rhamnogalacturonan acetylesterase [Lentisphaeraceae bacterium]
MKKPHSLFIFLTLLFFSQSLLSAEQKKITIALIGDSTVTTSAGWGKAFALRFNDKVTVHNFALGGRSSKSWLAEKHLPKALASKPDYVFIQFGHNGQPGKGPKRETIPQTTYKEFLQIYIDEFKSIGTIPVIISSVTRRKFDKDNKIASSLEPWAKAAQKVARDNNIPFIDLHRASIEYHNNIGPEASAKFNPKETDLTHFDLEGAKKITKLILQEFPKELKVLKTYLK